MLEWKYGTLPTSWELSTIGDYSNTITDYVANGSFASLAQNVQYKEEPDVAVLIRLVDYNNNFKGDFVYIDEHAYEFLSKSKLYGGEIIISNVGANVGTVFRCPTLTLKMSLAPNSIMLRTKGIDDFYYYWFKSPVGQHAIASIVTGSAQPKFNKTTFKKIVVPVPPIETQRKIALCLKTIDEKIECNKSINDNLEQQSQAIYASVFVDNADPTWQQGHLSDLVNVRYGKDHKKLADGIYPVYGSGGIMRHVERPLYDKESVLIPRKGTLNNVVYVNQPFWSVDTMFYTEMRLPNVAKFVYHFVKAKDLASMNAGSAVPSMTTDILNAMEVAIPPASVLEEFESLVAPMYRAMQENDVQSKKLADLRDTLLPKLMNGEIDVSGIQL